MNINDHKRIAIKKNLWARMRALKFIFKKSYICGLLGNICERAGHNTRSQGGQELNYFLSAKQNRLLKCEIYKSSYVHFTSFTTNNVWLMIASSISAWHVVRARTNRQALCPLILQGKSLPVLDKQFFFRCALIKITNDIFDGRKTRAALISIVLTKITKKQKIFFYSKSFPIPILSKTYFIHIFFYKNHMLDICLSLEFNGFVLFHH